MRNAILMIMEINNYDCVREVEKLFSEVIILPFFRIVWDNRP
jgi:hypothetical protein